MRDYVRDGSPAKDWDITTYRIDGDYTDHRHPIDELLGEEACFALKDLSINGNDVMALGFRGKEVGNALQACLDAVLDERISNDRDALLAF